MATTEVKPAVADEPVSSEIEVTNPATGEVIGTVPDSTPEQVAEAVARARAAQPGWEAMGFEGRGKVFKRAQKWVLDNSERIIDTIIAETGKTYEDAQLAEVNYAAHATGFWVTNAPKYLAEERVRTRNPMLLGRKLHVRYRPLGVVGVIGPWNYPLTNSFGDAIPALLAGNAVVLKPSEVTPFTSKLMEEMLLECGMPAGVFQSISGRGATGGALIEHVDYIMFTGSTRTGRKVAEAAGRNLIPCSLELGGKDPMIVCADADVERAANGAVYFSMQNCGQTCISVERIYVEGPIYDEFVGKVTEKVREIRQGRSSGPGSIEIGSLTFPPQVDTVESHVRDAVDKGARVLTGGQRPAGAGLFYPPTVMVDVDHTMDCMTEETFGPTMPIMKVRDTEEAIRLANDSPYGLQASVWTRDASRGRDIARRLEAGVALVNDTQVNYLALEAPMGGWKTSGIGSRHGKHGIRKYCRQQTVLVNPRPLVRKELFMFPYKARTTKMLGRVARLLYGRGKRD